MNKLSIRTEMAALDSKDRNFYKNLSTEEKKKFSNYLMIRWGSTIVGSPVLEEYYIRSCNVRLNKYFFNISMFPELQWLCATTISPGMGNCRHEWISFKKTPSNNKLRRFIEKQYPDLRDDEIDLMLKINTREDIEALAVELGYNDKQIRDEL